MILLAQEEAAITPVGWVLIIGFLAVLIFGLIYDKKKAKKFDEELDKKFDGQMEDGNRGLFVTPDRELVSRYSVGNYSGYETFKLDAIKYVMVAYDNTRGCRFWVVGLYDENKKIIKGKRYLSTKKKPSNARAYFTHFPTEKDAEFLWEFVHKHVPEAQRVEKFFKDLKE
uniref:hypothetical protein n=1 Tax=Acetatifactor sp. TaxID=1872090 RepID=UPI004056B6E5